MKFKYAPLADLGEPLNQRLGRYPRVADLTWDTLRWLGSWIAVGLLRLQFRLQVKGAIPQSERVALVANHQSHLDTVTVLAALPARWRRRVVVLAAADYFFHRVDRAMAASLLSQAVAFDRLHLSSLRHWRKQLQNTPSGWVLFYPSGSRSARRLQTGLLKLFLQAGWTVVPVHLEGTQQAWPVGSPCWRPFRRLQVTFLSPCSDLDQLMTQLNQDSP